MKPAHELTRASLILRLQDADDMAAWDEFAAIYAPVVFNVATSRGFQAADADNLVQEVFMSVAAAVSNWLQRDDRGSFRAWLLRIARNAAVDMITQKTTRSLGRDGSEAQLHLANLPAPSELSSALDLEYERLIGSGGMGVVLKAFDTELNRPVAIKLLAPYLASSGAARKRFAREARAAAAVVHQHVVPIHNVETERESPFIVMQYVSGESLQARIDREGPLELCEILRIGMQVADALSATHQQGL